MNFYFVIFFFSLILSSVLRIVWFLFGKNLNKSSEKISTFECGFNPLKKARVIFSLRFFLVIMLFLIFEIEVVLLLPLILIKLSFRKFSIYIFIFVIFILLLGLVHEWNQGCLDWVFFSSIIKYFIFS